MGEDRRQTTGRRWRGQTTDDGKDREQMTARTDDRRRQGQRADDSEDSGQTTARTAGRRLWAQSVGRQASTQVQDIAGEREPAGASGETTREQKEYRWMRRQHETAELGAGLMIQSADEPWMV